MRQAPPTSVLLSTVRWTPVIEELADQLGPEDEMLVICDADDDPVAAREAEFPAGVRLVVAGEPEGCSGKANAVSAGLEAAANDRIVLTDDDFEHPPDWLETLHGDYERHGPVSEVPAFVGKDPLAVLLEPSYVVSNSVGIYNADQPWGGAVIFERDDIDVQSFLADLRRTISDDGLLADYLECTTVRRTRRVDVGGTVRETVERHVRFTQIVYRHAPTWQVPIYLAVTVLTTAGALYFALPALVLTTLFAGGLYAFFGVRRWTFLLAYPAVVLDTPLLLYSLARRTFVWGGRRYRWKSKFDVRIIGSA